MKMTYRPDGGEERTWPYVPDEMPYAEAELLEEVLDCTFEQFKSRVEQGGARARRALLWVMLRRESPQLRLSDVQLKRAGELLVEYDVAELQRMREAALKNDDLKPAEREGLLKTLDALEFDQIAEATTPAGPKGKSSGRSGDSV